MPDRMKLGRQGNLVVSRVTSTERRDTHFIAWFFCPGCEEAHAFYVPRWTFNGDYERPTFSPSLICQAEKRCHLFLRDGQLEFCSDSQHALAGKTVPLPEPPEWL